MEEPLIQGYVHSGTDLNTKLPGKYAKFDIAKSGVNSLGTTTTIYTIPIGKYFILEGYWLHAREKASVAGGSDATLKCSDPTINILLGGSLCLTQTMQLQMTLPRGLRFPAGIQFYIDSGSSDISVWAGIIGYEIAQEDLLYLD